MKSIIVSGFPGVGKTDCYLQSTRRHVGAWYSDSDSSHFSWKYVGGKKIRDPAFPGNYIEYIKSIKGLYDVIFVSSHEEVRTALMDAGMFYFLVYPDIDDKKEYLERYVARGSDPAFIYLVDQNWDAWIKSCQEASDCSRQQLKPGQFMSDIIDDLLELRNLLP